MKPLPTPLLVAVVGALAVVGFQFPANVAERSYEGFPDGAVPAVTWATSAGDSAVVTRRDGSTIVLTTLGSSGCASFPTGVVATSAHEVLIHVRAPMGACPADLVTTSYELALPAPVTAQDVTVTIDYWPTGESRILELQ